MEKVNVNEIEQKIKDAVSTHFEGKKATAITKQDIEKYTCNLLKEMALEILANPEKFVKVEIKDGIATINFDGLFFIE